MLIHVLTAVDEQNAQTKEQLERLKESPLYKADSSELLDVTQSASRRGLQADSETSRSAPTFSIFTLEAAPKTPLSSPRSIGRCSIKWCVPHQVMAPYKDGPDYLQLLSF